MPWRIQYDGHTLREGDITLAQAEHVEELTGESWLRINPYRSARHARAIVTVMYAAATGVQVADVAEKIGQIKVSDFLEMVDVVEDDTPQEYTDGFPRPAEGTSTPSS